MRVLFIINSTKQEGSIISFCNLLEGLLSKGVKCYVIVPRNPIDNDFLENKLRKLNVRFYWVKWLALSKKPECSSFSDLLLYPLKLVWLILKKIRCFIVILFHAARIKPDIIHTNIGPIHEGFYVAKTLKIPHVWHLREYQDLDFNWKIFPSKNYLIAKLKRSNVIAISKDIFRHFRLNNAHAIMIYNGVLPYNEVKNEKKENYFLIANRISKEKGIESAIRAFYEFHKCNKEYKLFIAGTGDNEYMHYLKDMVSDYQLCKSIIFLGFRTDIPQLMSKAIAVLVMSRCEGFGRMTAEALFSGTLVIGNNTGGTKEIIELTNGGYLFNEVSEIPDIMKKIVEINKEGTFDLMVKAAQYTARNAFSCENNIEETYGYYIDILK